MGFKVGHGKGTVQPELQPLKRNLGDEWRSTLHWKDKHINPH